MAAVLEVHLLSGRIFPLRVATLGAHIAQQTQEMVAPAALEANIAQQIYEILLSVLLVV